MFIFTRPTAEQVIAIGIEEQAAEQAFRGLRRRPVRRDA